MVENAAPNLRSWVRQGIDVTKVMEAAADAEAAAATAAAAAVAARTAADQAIAAANSGGGTGTGLVYPETIIGSSLLGQNLMKSPGIDYVTQQQAARTIINAPKLGTAATDAAPGTLAATVASLATRVTALEAGSTGVAGKDNIDVDTDGVPYWRD